MFQRFFRQEPIDIPRRVVGTVGGVLGISALVVLIIGPSTLYLCQHAPSAWQIVLDYHFLVVFFLLVCFSAAGRLLAHAMFLCASWILEAMGATLRSWLRPDISRALALTVGAALALVVLTLGFDLSWWSGGGGIPGHDAYSVGLIETGFTLMMAIGLVSSLSPYALLHPEVRDHVIPIGEREKAWCMLTLETSVAVAIGSFSYFAFIHQDELTGAGLNDLWIWAGLTLSVAILASGIILFFRLVRRDPRP